MSETSSQTGEHEKRGESSRTASQSGEDRPPRASRFPLPPVKGTMGGIAPSRLGPSQYLQSTMTRSTTVKERNDKTEEVRDMEGVLTGASSSYSLGDTASTGRFKVDPTLKTCFSAERDGADLVRLWA